MKQRLLATAAAFGLAVGLGASAPASAAVFALFNPVPGTPAATPNFTEDGAGNLTSTTSTTPTLVTFETGPLAALKDLAATFTFSASESAPAVNGMMSGVSVTSSAFGGSFSYYYDGPNETVGGFTLDKGDLLLGGTFSNAAFLGVTGGPGAGLFDNSLTGTVTYSTDLPSSLLPLSSDGQSFSIAFADISPLLGATMGHLNGFNAVGDGKFSSELNGGGGGGGVPEPATWALMLIGVSGVGACLRRRTRPVSAAA